ncbi:hypothetical protein RJ639_046834 [Escallonia herrerae]|uniref:Topoisomerase 6 subunit A/Spo11 TOPRIM domain-containing protein n=1 Tax=Escallonia herrerae TaxID=1293975 RepID=A0AA88W3J8_9ASTE|nr:hypothetical protein RJ639_046834 [Escallonia herrerae]
MGDLCKSSIFFSDQHLCNADILPPPEVRARIEVSVLNFLRTLSSPTPAISDLPLEPNQEVVDCTACGSSGYAISGDLNLLEKLVLKTDARYIFVVEKHAIFQRMAEDRVFNQIPSILITGKGYPDIATRNPAGLAIVCTYKYGSIAMGLEAYRYGDTTQHHIIQITCHLACNVKWLGLRRDDLQLIPEESFAPLKPRDLQIAKSLTASEILPDKYKEELAVMVESGHRAEIEALYYHGYSFLGKYLVNKIVQASYI